MPKGTEPTLGLIVQALENDAELSLIMDLETATVYLEDVPSPFTYPFMVITEGKDSYADRNSETIGGNEENAFFNEYRRITVATCSNSGDTAWKMIERFRKKFVDNTGGVAIDDADTVADNANIQCLPESIQILQNTHIKDTTGKEVWSSMQKFALIASKQGSN